MSDHVDASKTDDSTLEFEQLIQEYQGPLLRYAYKILRNADTAQDIVQDAFIRYIKNPPRYGVPRQKASWLFRVTHNLCIDLVKRESRRSEIYDKVDKPQPLDMPSENLMTTEGWGRLLPFLDQLSDNQRIVVILFFQEGKSYKEISDVTDLSLSNVGMLLHRGLKKLKKLMDDSDWITK